MRVVVRLGLEELPFEEKGMLPPPPPLLLLQRCCFHHTHILSSSPPSSSTVITPRLHLNQNQNTVVFYQCARGGQQQ